MHARFADLVDFSSLNTAVARTKRTNAGKHRRSGVHEWDEVNLTRYSPPTKPSKNKHELWGSIVRPKLDFIVFEILTNSMSSMGNNDILGQFIVKNLISS